MKSFTQNQAKEYGFKTSNELFTYGVESHINGQKKQSKEILNLFTLFDEIKEGVYCSYKLFGMETTVMACYYAGLHTTPIVNAFYDFGTREEDIEATKLINDLLEKDSYDIAY